MNLTAVGNLALSVGQIALLNKAFVKPKRSIGDVIPGVVLREQHRDTLDITEHPVDRGVVIADHAIKRPAEVTIECGWSASPAGQSFLSLVPAPAQKTPTEIYQRLVKMMNDLELVDVLTGKRKYSNCLLIELETETDKDTENALICRATFREIRIVGVKVLDLNTAADAAKQKSPAITLPTIEAGVKQLVPAPLYHLLPGAPGS